MSVYSVKSVKSFRGREGSGFNAVLLKDGKKVADVLDDASGGPVTFDWVDRAAPKVKVERAQATAGLPPVDAMLSPEHAEFFNAAQKIPSASGFMADEIYVSDLVNAVFAETRCRKMLKAKVCVLFEGRVSTYKAAPEAATLARFAIACPPRGEVLLNLLPEQEALAIMVKALA